MCEFISLDDLKKTEDSKFEVNNIVCNVDIEHKYPHKVAVDIYETNNVAKIAIGLMGNGAQPGGTIGHKSDDGTPYVKNKELRKKYKRGRQQEESIVSNWLLTSECMRATNPSALYAKLDWGLTSPNDKKDFSTKQNINYKTANPKDYGSKAWGIKNALISAKPSNCDETAKCTLVFVAGPQANKKKSKPPSTKYDYTATMQRTMNESARDNYEFFKSCVKEAFRAALHLMILNGDRIAIHCNLCTRSRGLLRLRGDKPTRS